jgi:acyl-CoA synthetase (AMP-forming)/AMP-acid ligase II
MSLLDRLRTIWAGVDYPCVVDRGNALRFAAIEAHDGVDLSAAKAGDVVAVVGAVDPPSILALLRLIDRGSIVVPLSAETEPDHEYFLESAHVDAVVRDGRFQRRRSSRIHPLIEALRRRGHAGLVLFSTGTTGRPKAILHDLTHFLRRYDTPRPPLRTLGFLAFDHIGGINTLLHALFNRGMVVAPAARTVDSVLQACDGWRAQVLPTTPTFLRTMLMSGAVPDRVPACLELITYGTERMDQPTLTELCRLLPAVDFRQTYGMSELGIVRVKSEARDSLFMRIGGEGIETRVVDHVLHIRSESRMAGYLNAPSPFDADGWYDTKDVVEERNGYYRIVGRTSDVINVGGLKFAASEVERVALMFPGVSLVRVYPQQNPITGQHVELVVQPSDRSPLDPGALRQYLESRLQAHMVPRRIRIDSISVSHRFKRA